MVVKINLELTTTGVQARGHREGALNGKWLMDMKGRGKVIGCG
jgi:hypothetical protein